MSVLDVINTTVPYFIYYIYIYLEIFCHGTSVKKTHLATWGLEPASPVSVNRHAMLINHHASSKKKNVLNYNNNSEHNSET